MKKQFINILLLSAVLGMAGCGKDFLERPKEGEIKEEEFWNNESDLKNALNSIYGYLGKMDKDGLATLMDGQNSIYDDGASDNAYAQYPWESNAADIAKGSVTSSMNDGWDFRGIRRVNDFMEHVDSVKMNDADRKERYKAEARFLRAFFYGNMVCKFGDVPLITKTLSVEESYVKRTPKADVLKFVYSELDAVSKVLPTKYESGSKSELGRATKGAALAFKARLHLYNNEYAAAAAAAAEVMKIPGYDLFMIRSESETDKKDNYDKWVDFADDAERQRFRLGLRSYEQMFWAPNKRNVEVIFDRQHMLQKDPQSENTYLLPAIADGWSSVTPTQELVDAYESFKTGQPRVPLTVTERAARYAKKDTDPAFYQEYKNLDPRFYATVLFESSQWNALGGLTFNWSRGSNNSQNGYNFRKLVDPTAWPVYDNYANHIIIRLAEVLLTYAEAKNEVSGPDGTIYDAIDRIRERAGMPKLDRTRYASQSALREAIRRERRIELALEGQRYMDIRRWKTAPTVMAVSLYAIDGAKVDDRVWDNKLFLLPVPQKDIDINKNLLPNNTGY